MASLLSSFGTAIRRAFRPTETLGAPGTAVRSGVVDQRELVAELSYSQRYKTFGEMLVNASIIGAGVRGYLNLAATSEWTFEPADDDTSGEFAERAEEILKSDPATPWHRVVRRAMMYRYYGFSVQEWTARRRDDGVVTLADIAPRPQNTIERWDTEEDGNVLGIIQRSPQTMREIYLPRQKALYVVDDSLSDSPEGLGLFRHLFDPYQRLKAYELLEGQGFDADLNGVPVGRGPFTVLDEMVKNSEITAQQRNDAEQVLRDFITNRRKGPSKGLLLDSKTYETTDDASRPSNVPLWAMEILNSSPGTQDAVAAAIERVNREMGRIQSCEHLLLGSDSAGSFAMSQSKMGNHCSMVNGVLREVRETVDEDLIKTIWRLNGWPEEMRPRCKTEDVQIRDAEQVAAAMRDIASSGVLFSRADPVVNEVLGLMGMSPLDVDADMEDAALSGRVTEGSEDLEDVA